MIKRRMMMVGEGEQMMIKEDMEKTEEIQLMLMKKRKGKKEGKKMNFKRNSRRNRRSNFSILYNMATS